MSSYQVQSSASTDRLFFEHKIEECLQDVPLSTWDEIRAARRALCDRCWWSTVTVSPSTTPLFSSLPPASPEEHINHVLRAAALKVQRLLEHTELHGVPFDYRTWVQTYISNVCHSLLPGQYPVRALIGSEALLVHEKLEMAIQVRKEELERKVVKTASRLMNTPPTRKSIHELIPLNPHYLLLPNQLRVAGSDGVRLAIRTEIHSHAPSEFCVWDHAKTGGYLDPDFVLNVLKMCSEESRGADVHSVLGSIAMAKKVWATVPPSWKQDDAFISMATDDVLRRNLRFVEL